MDKPSKTTAGNGTTRDEHVVATQPVVDLDARRSNAEPTEALLDAGEGDDAERAQVEEERARQRDFIKSLAPATSSRVAGSRSWPRTP